MSPLFRLLLASAIVVSVAPAYANDDEFIGFYRGVFAEGGSLESLSIVPDPSGGVQILLHATRYVRCEGADRSAVATANGTVRDGILYRTNGAGVCNSDGSNVNWRDAEMSLSHDDELLTGRTAAGRQVIYHRVSD